MDADTAIVLVVLAGVIWVFRLVIVARKQRRK